MSQRDRYLTMTPNSSKLNVRSQNRALALVGYLEGA